jgi:hypothetical protein
MAGFAEPSVESTGSEIDDNNALFLISTLPFPSLLPIEDREGRNRDESLGLLTTFRYPPILVAPMDTDVRFAIPLRDTDPDTIVTAAGIDMDVVDPPNDSDPPTVFKLGKLRAPQSLTAKFFTTWRAVKSHDPSNPFKITVSEKLAAPWYSGAVNAVKTGLLLT